MYHLLEFIGDGISIPWKSIWNFYVYFCHNLCFFVLEKVRLMSWFFWQYFILSSFLQLCYWFCLNSWDTTGASAKNISVAGRLHSSNFIERSSVNQRRHKSRCSLTLGGFFPQLIDEAPNTGNLLYQTEVKDTFWTIYMLLIVIFNQRSDQLFLYVLQCYCDIHNLPIRNLVKWRSLACGYLSRDNFHCSIQNSVVSIPHGGETWLEQGGGKSGGASNMKPWKRSWGVSQWLSMEGKRISFGQGGGCGAWGFTSMMITP